MQINTTAAKTVLIVEDSPVHMAFFQQQLESAGYIVKAASSAARAFELLNSGTFQLALIDLILPDGDSMALINRLREHHPETGIIAVSSGGPVEPEMFLKGALHAGAHHALPKPVKSRQLLTLARQLTEKTA